MIRGRSSLFFPGDAGSSFFSQLFQRQETVGQHHQAGVVVEAAPGAALEMIQAQFLLHLLVALLHRPAALPQPDRPEPAGVAAAGC